MEVKKAEEQNAKLKTLLTFHKEVCTISELFGRIGV
jgi:hypothetical protein